MEVRKEEPGSWELGGSTYLRLNGGVDVALLPGPGAARGRVGCLKLENCLPCRHEQQDTWK